MVDHDLWVCGVGAAGVDAAGASGLSEHVHEDRDGGGAGSRGDMGGS